ncbi:MAG: TetR/AcrR family transcriptional regulator [Solirubrobacteraceae bacterium]
MLDATSELLRDTSLADLSVAQILDAARVGRTSFYEHFDSKEDVVVELVQSVGARLAEQLAPVFARGERSPDEAIDQGLSSLAAAWARDAPLLIAIAEEWPAIPRLRALWLSLHGQLTSRLASVIDADRAAGLAPPGADSRALAASLVWTVERALHVAGCGASPALPDQASLVAPLRQLLIGGIYGRAPEQRRWAPPP